MVAGPLGFIAPKDRTREQQNAHDVALSKMIKFAAPPIPAGPVNVRLFNAWTHPDVIADCGGVSFNRFHQITGSCVGAGGGNALFSLIASQRLFADSPMKAFIPWWPWTYGKSRLLAGMRTPGEGSLGSTFFEACKQGVMDSNNSGLPKFDLSDGLTLSRSIELQWSDGDSSTVEAWDAEATQHPLGAGAEIKDVTGLRAAIVNGYPCTWACNNYVGSARVEGTGSDAALIGYWDTYGPHQQSVHAVWDHPNFGPLYWVQNNWPGSVYPRDPAGGPVCGCWVRESKVTAAFRLDSEVFALSQLPWFPAQPKVLEWGSLGA